jgi:plastocyanin
MIKNNLRRIRFAVFLSILLVLSVASSTYAADHAVNVNDNTFNQREITIAPGDRVVWTHRGNNPHTVTASDGSFDSHPNCTPVCMMNGNTFSRTFNNAGNFTYYCKVHGTAAGQGMAGVVRVVAPQAAGGEQQQQQSTSQQASTQSRQEGSLAQSGYESAPVNRVAVVLLGVSCLLLGAVYSCRRSDKNFL